MCTKTWLEVFDSLFSAFHSTNVSRFTRSLRLGMAPCIAAWHPTIFDGLPFNGIDEAAGHIIEQRFENYTSGQISDLAKTERQKELELLEEQRKAGEKAMRDAQFLAILNSCTNKNNNFLWFRELRR